MVEANNPKGGPSAAGQNQEEKKFDQSFEEILRDSGYSVEQVRGIAQEVAARKAKNADESQGERQTPQTQAAGAKTSTSGGIHTNDDTTVKQYFSYYAKLANQQNMLEDSVRTPKYREAIVENPTNFRGKVVMDVGCGSGILSIFAAQAGAKKVYACEASGAANIARTLIKANGFENVIEVI